jgi:3-oxoacyl-[acyl-carrier protein] reductase
LADPASIERAFASARAIAPHIDALAVTAGILHLDKLANLSLTEWNRVMAINLTGPFLCCQAAQTWLRDGGRMVLTGSLAGRTGGVLTGTAYAVSKGGIESLTKSMAQELAPRRITVNCVAPGFIQTDMTAQLPETQQKMLMDQIPAGHLGTPEDVAHAVSYLASPQAGYVTGQELHVNGGMFMA